MTRATRIYFTNLFHKIDRSDPDNPRIMRNKYQLWVNKHQIYKGFSHVACNCYSYYKNFVCKHLIIHVDLFGFSTKGYKKLEEFATNAKRVSKKGSLKTKKSNPLADDYYKYKCRIFLIDFILNLI